MKLSLKNEYTIAAGKLALVGFIGVLLVCITYWCLMGLQERQRSEEIEKRNHELFPDAASFSLRKFPVTLGGGNFYEVNGSAGSLMGYIVPVVGNGFCSELSLWVAFTQDLQIQNVLLESTEEINGKRWEQEKMLGIFKGTNTLSHPFPLRKSMVKEDMIDSVTGATITFNGITEALRSVIYNLEHLSMGGKS